VEKARWVISASSEKLNGQKSLKLGYGGGTAS